MQLRIIGELDTYSSLTNITQETKTPQNQVIASEEHTVTEHPSVQTTHALNVGHDAVTAAHLAGHNRGSHRPVGQGGHLCCRPHYAVALAAQVAQLGKLRGDIPGVVVTKEGGHAEL